MRWRAVRDGPAVEGEFIPVRNEELDLGNIDGLLLLPITIEHTIDERSPLCGHTHDSLKALNAEIVVTFEGTTETGAPLSSRAIQTHSHKSAVQRLSNYEVIRLHRLMDGPILHSPPPAPPTPN